MYLLSIICVVVVMAVICLLCFGTDVSYLMYLVDPVTILIFLALLIPLLMAGGFLKDLNNAFRLGIGKKAAASLTELKRAEEAVSLTIKMLIAASFFIFFAETLFILLIVDDLSVLGPHMSVAVLILVYGFGTSLILLPLKSILTMKIQEYIGRQE